MPVPGAELRLDDRDRERLGGFVTTTTRDLETEFDPVHRKIAEWWKVYEAKPRSNVRSFPWKHAANVVLPLARTWGGAIVARHFARLTSMPQFWTGATENEAWREIVAAWIPYLNWSARGNVFDLFLSTWDVLSEMVPQGSSHFALSWSEQTQLRYTPRSAREGGPPVTLFSHRGPLVEQVPRQDLLFVPGRSTMDSEIVVRRRLMTRAELLAFQREAKLDREMVDKVLESPDERATEEDAAERRAGFGRNAVPMYNIRQAWIDFPVLEGEGLERVIPPDRATTKRPPVPIVVTFHPATQSVLRVIAHPYYFSHKPFYDVHFDKRPGRADSMGVAEMADHLQRTATTMINQSIDAVTLANSVNFVTTDRRLADYKFSPSRPIVVDNLQSMLFPTLSKQVVPDLSLINAIIAAGERLFSVGDPALGRETRLGGHPSPATSTLAMLEQLAINVSVSLRFLRHRMSQLGEDISTLFQQFEAALGNGGRIEAAVGFRDAEVIKRLVLPLDAAIAGNVRFDVNALSEVTSPEAERAKVVLEDQMLTNYYSQLLGAAQILQSPVGQDPMVQEIVRKAIEGKTITMKRFLSTTDFDNIEDVLLELGDSRAAQLGLLQQSLGALDRIGAGPTTTTLPISGVAPGPAGAPGANGEDAGALGPSALGFGG